MTWENRLRLLGGVLGVIALVAILTLVFNHRQNTITSYTGQVTATTYSVGADHAGTVVEQFANGGDVVTKGERLFTVQSLQLKQDIFNGLEVGDTEAYTVDPKRGTLTYRAVIDGQIDRIEARLGNSVPAGGSLATITALGDRFVTAQFRLVPRDYARLHAGAPARITLPDDRVIEGSVEQVAVTTSLDGTASSVRLSVPGLKDLAESSLASPGTPVTVAVSLEDSGPLAGLTDVLNDFLQKIGMR